MERFFMIPNSVNLIALFSKLEITCYTDFVSRYVDCLYFVLIV